MPYQDDTNAPRFILRREARSVPYHKLDERQRAGFDQVIDFLEAAATRVGRPAPASSQLAGTFVDPDRTSRTMLISGQRGTGKTTLLLTLAQALCGEPGWRDQNPRRDKLLMLSKRLVWLETLDMEPLDSTTNLLNAVLARVESAFDSRRPEPVSDDTLALLYREQSDGRTLRDLGLLQTSLALSYSSNIKDRGGSLDPDSYAIEVRRTERERLGLNERFSDILSRLSMALEGHGLDKPLFVLPVDDLDLNPATCVPLLSLLRSVQSPHLVIILLADLELLSTIMRLKFSGDFTRLSLQDSLDRSIREQVQDQVHDLAQNALEKHFPPSQRVTLGRPTPKWALGFSPETGDQPNLAALVNELRLGGDKVSLPSTGWGGASTPPLTVRLPVTSGGGDDRQDEVPFHVADGYSWFHAFSMSLRQLTDLYTALKQNQDPLDQKQDPIAALIGKHAGTRLEELNRGNPKDSDQERRIVQRLSYRDVERGDHRRIQLGEFDGWNVTLALGPLNAVRSRTYVGCLDLMNADVPTNLRQYASENHLRVTRISFDEDRDWPWPELTHTTYWGYERVVLWLKAAQDAWANQADPLFGSWVAVMSRVLYEAVESKPAHLLPPRDMPANWEAVRQLLGKLDPHRPLTRAWLQEVGLLCTPEMGMEIEQDLGIPDDLQAEVAERREERLTQVPERIRPLISRWKSPA